MRIKSFEDIEMRLKNILSAIKDTGIPQQYIDSAYSLVHDGGEYGIVLENIICNLLDFNVSINKKIYNEILFLCHQIGLKKEYVDSLSKLHIIEN